ncbi:Stf0 family sulfotransferase [Paroceanicella profunda]|uniref:Stf0 family sulfotransferase n=1 Tax=Paroceanicella profunda TaxID=2579971 RepID=UPI0014790B9F|nr:Stf0 family sulfotransferase [Paroceanicella profunda]
MIILASQRCGSTLITEDIAATGRMGRPDEHLLPLLRAAPDAPLPDFFAQGMCDDCFGAKVMIGQFEGFGAYLDAPRRALSLLDAGDRAGLAADFLSGIERRFDPVTWLWISRRDRFAQAYSRLRARATGVYHHRQSGGPLRQRPPVTTEITPATLHEEMGRIAADDAFFARTVARCGIAPLHIVYEDYLAEPEACFAAISRHAGLDLSRPAERATRTEKIVDTPELEAARAAFEAVHGAGSAAPAEG